MSSDPWEASNARRLELCDKLFDAGLTPDEHAELDRLQVEAGRVRRESLGRAACAEHNKAKADRFDAAREASE